MSSDITVDADQFKQYYQAISKIDVALGKEMGKKMRQLAKPLVEEVRTAVLNTPAGRSAGETRYKKGSGLGLRASLAAATKADVNKTGRGAAVHIRVSKSKMLTVGGRPGSLAFYYDGRKSNWRHPTFGRIGPDDWFDQKPHPFLGKTLYPHKEKFAKDIMEILNDTLDKMPQH